MFNLLLNIPNNFKKGLNKINLSHIFLATSLILLIGCIEKSSDILGTIELDKVTLLSTANEIIVKQSVRKGDLVKKGDILINLDSNKQQDIVNKAKSMVNSYTSNLSLVSEGSRKEDIEIARAELERSSSLLTQMKSNYDRILEISNRGAVSQMDKDNAISNYLQAQASNVSAKEKLNKAIAGNRNQEIEQAKSQLASANADLQLQIKILSDLTIVATRDGVIDSINFNEGERVTAGAPLITLLTGKPYARVYITETIRSKITVGSSFLITIDGVDKSIPAKLRWIAKDPSFTPYYALSANDRSRLMYQAELDLENYDVAIKVIGMPIQAKIVDNVEKSIINKVN